MLRLPLKAPLVSYAQNFEDVMLWRALGDCAGGSFVDVGAQDPVVDSISHLFRDQGWHGVHVEPHPSYADALRKSCPNDLVIQAAVGIRRELLPFFQIDATGLSTLDGEIAKRHRENGFDVRELLTSVITLDDVLSASPKGEVQWLKIDVEGLETQVLKGWRKNPVRPWVVVVESTAPLSQQPSFAPWEPLLLRKGYEFAYADGLNRFYLSTEHADRKGRFALPPNVFDGFRMSGLASAPYHLAISERHKAEIHTLQAQQEQEHQRLTHAFERVQVEVRLAQNDLVAQRSLLLGQVQRGRAQLAEVLKTSSANQYHFHLEVDRSWEEARAQHTQAISSQETRIQLLQEDLRWQRADGAVKARDFAERAAEWVGVADAHREAHRVELQEIAERFRREFEDDHQLHAQQLADARAQEQAMQEQAAAKEAQWASLLDASRMQAAQHLQDALVQESRHQGELDAAQSRATAERMVLLQQLADVRVQEQALQERASAKEAQWASQLDVSRMQAAQHLQGALSHETRLLGRLNSAQSRATAERIALLKQLTDARAQQQALQAQAASREAQLASRLDSAEMRAVLLSQNTLLLEARLQGELEAVQVRSSAERMALLQQLTDAREREQALQGRGSINEVKWANLLDTAELRATRHLQAALRRETLLQEELDAGSERAAAERRELLQQIAQVQADRNQRSQELRRTLQQALEASYQEAESIRQQCLGSTQEHHRLLSNQLDEAHGAHQKAQAQLEGEVRDLRETLAEQLQATQADAALLNKELIDLKTRWAAIQQGGLLGWLVRRSKFLDPSRDECEIEPAPATIAASPSKSYVSTVAFQPQFSESTFAMPESATSVTNIVGAPAASSVAGVAETLAELILLGDESFVYAAYRSILLREPDPAGYADFVRQVRAGVAKERIIVAMAVSSEGISAGSRIEGLANLLRQYPLAPGGWRARIRQVRQSANEQVLQRLRALDNKVVRLMAVQSQKALLADDVNTLQNQVLQLTAALTALSASSSNDRADEAAMRRQINERLDTLAALGQHTLSMAEGTVARGVQLQARLDMLVQLCTPAVPQADPREVALDTLQGQLGPGGCQVLARIRQAANIAAAQEQV